MHVALIGGPGAGKTNASKELCEHLNDSEYVYMSRYAVRIPMALQHLSHPDLLTYSRQEYIDAVLSNLDAQELKFKRAEMDVFASNVFKRYGPNVAGEIAFASVPEGKIGVFDGVATVENVKYMKEKGVYIVGLKCAFETQLKRRLEDGRDIDPKGRTEMSKQILATQKLYELERIMPLADVIYNTDCMSALEVACAIAPVILAVRQ